jgi:hypothetical protein
MHEAGRRATWLHLTAYPRLAFARNFLLKGGFRDGDLGLVLSTLNSYYVFLKYVKLWELQRRPVLHEETKAR